MKGVRPILYSFLWNFWQSKITCNWVNSWTLYSPNSSCFYSNPLRIRKKSKLTEFANILLTGSRDQIYARRLTICLRDSTRCLMKVLTITVYCVMENLSISNVCFFSLTLALGSLDPYFPFTSFSLLRGHQRMTFAKTVNSWTPNSPLCCFYIVLYQEFFTQLEAD